MRQGSLSVEVGRRGGQHEVRSWFHRSVADREALVGCCRQCERAEERSLQRESSEQFHENLDGAREAPPRERDLASRYAGDREARGWRPVRYKAAFDSAASRTHPATEGGLTCQKRDKIEGEGRDDPPQALHVPTMTSLHIRTMQGMQGRNGEQVGVQRTRHWTCGENLGMCGQRVQSKR